MACRCLTKEEKIIHGLTTGHDAPLDVFEEGIAGRGVFALADIEKGSWLTEYKAAYTYPPSEQAKHESEYDLNQVKGSYIVESQYPIPGVGKLCWDATYYYHQLGRYLNHAQQANAEITRPFFARGKWRIGFVAIRNIAMGEEVVWDYGVRGEPWSGCRLVQGVIKEKEEEQRTNDQENQGFISVRQDVWFVQYDRILGSSSLTAVL